MTSDSSPLTRGSFDQVALTSSLVPHDPSTSDPVDGFAVSAAYSDAGRTVRGRGQLRIAEGMVGFSPFQRTHGMVEISCTAMNVTMTRRPWPRWGWQLKLNGQVPVIVAVPWRSQRQIREALSTAGARTRRRM